MLRTSLILAPLILITACGEDTAVPPPPTPGAQSTAPAQTPDVGTNVSVELPSIGPKAETTRKADIDWTSARADLAPNDGLASIQSVGEEPANVPVLLPTGIVVVQSADSGPVFRRTDDGYFAFYPGEIYNIIVNGTNQVVVANAVAGGNPERAPVFTTSESSAQVWLTRYGADYTVDFECNVLVDGESSCIEEQAAMEITNNLIVSGSR